jgi:Fic family protein
MAKQKSSRAGEYALQPAGYRAFVPRPLPPKPSITIDDEIWSLLSKADQALGRLDGSTGSLPDADSFVFGYVIKEAVLSSQIEGTQASLVDVLRFESDPVEAAPRSTDVAEVNNYIEAMNYGLARLQSLPVSLRLIREIHERLMKDVRGQDRRPGEFRATQNWVGTAGSPIEDADYVPPPPPEMLTALHDLETFIYGKQPMPDLVKVGLVHSQFETIHPFLDGNGRVGRLLITFLLCERQIMRRPLLYLSRYFNQNREAYYEHLQAVRDSGHWERWLKFFLRGVQEVAEEATATAQTIVSMREEQRRLVGSHFGRGAHKALLLLEGLYFRPHLSVAAASSITGLTFPNANALVAQFVELGLLVEVTGRRRDRRFIFEPYVDVLNR